MYHLFRNLWSSTSPSSPQRQQQAPSVPNATVTTTVPLTGDEVPPSAPTSSSVSSRPSDAATSRDVSPTAIIIRHLPHGAAPPVAIAPSSAEGAGGAQQVHALLSGSCGSASIILPTISPTEVAPSPRTTPSVIVRPPAPLPPAAGLTTQPTTGSAVIDAASVRRDGTDGQHQPHARRQRIHHCLPGGHLVAVLRRVVLDATAAAAEKVIDSTSSETRRCHCLLDPFTFVVLDDAGDVDAARARGFGTTGTVAAGTAGGSSSVASRMLETAGSVASASALWTDRANAADDELLDDAHATAYLVLQLLLHPALWADPNLEPEWFRYASEAAARMPPSLRRLRAAQLAEMTTHREAHCKLIAIATSSIEKKLNEGVTGRSDRLEDSGDVVSPVDEALRRRWARRPPRFLRLGLEICSTGSLTRLLPPCRVHQILHLLPQRHHGSRWRVLYATDTDGFSLESFYRRVAPGAFKSDSFVSTIAGGGDAPLGIGAGSSSMASTSDHHPRGLPPGTAAAAAVGRSVHSVGGACLLIAEVQPIVRGNSRDDRPRVIGAYLSDLPDPSHASRHFYGTHDCFVFSFRPAKRCHARSGDQSGVHQVGHQKREPKDRSPRVMRFAPSAAAASGGGNSANVAEEIPLVSYGGAHSDPCRNSAGGTSPGVSRSATRATVATPFLNPVVTRNLLPRGQIHPRAFGLVATDAAVLTNGAHGDGRAITTTLLDDDHDSDEDATDWASSSSSLSSEECENGAAASPQTAHAPLHNYHHNADAPRVHRWHPGAPPYFLSCGYSSLEIGGGADGAAIRFTDRSLQRGTSSRHCDAFDGAPCLAGVPQDPAVPYSEFRTLRLLLFALDDTPALRSGRGLFSPAATTNTTTSVVGMEDAAAVFEANSNGALSSGTKPTTTTATQNAALEEGHQQPFSACESYGCHCRDFRHHRCSFLVERERRRQQEVSPISGRSRPSSVPAVHDPAAPGAQERLGSGNESRGGFLSRWFGGRGTSFEKKPFVPVPPEGELM